MTLEEAMDAARAAMVHKPGCVHDGARFNSLDKVEFPLRALRVMRIAKGFDESILTTIGGKRWRWFGRQRLMSSYQIECRECGVRVTGEHEEWS